MEPPFRAQSESEMAASCFIMWALTFVAPTQIRTKVLALKGLRPGSLDDGGVFISASTKIIGLQ